jgi:hypothetical protein
MIQVEKLDDTTFRVAVAAGGTTTHTVTVTEDYYQKLTAGEVSPEKLVEKSFEFLLDHEPNTSILGRFDLPVIGRYFPEYEREIKRTLGS